MVYLTLMAISCAATGASADCFILSLIDRQGWKMVALNAFGCAFNATIAVVMAFKAAALMS